MVRHYLDGKGKPRITGGKDLKASENYPRLRLVLRVRFSFVPSAIVRFGRAMGRLRTVHARRLKRDANKVVKQNLKAWKAKSTPLNNRASARWSKWAELGPVFDFFV